MMKELFDFMDSVFAELDDEMGEKENDEVIVVDGTLMWEDKRAE